MRKKLLIFLIILCTVNLVGCGGPSGKYYRYDKDGDTYEEDDYFDFTGGDLIYSENGTPYICKYNDSGKLIEIKLDNPGNPLDMTFEYDSNQETLTSKYDIFKKKGATNKSNDDNILSYTGKINIEDEFGQLIVTNANIKKAKAETIKDSNDNVSYVVDLTLDDTGTRSFADATTRASKSQASFKIYVDDVLVSNPVVQSPITGGSVYITGFTTLDDAKSCAKAIKKYK